MSRREDLIGTMQESINAIQMYIDDDDHEAVIEECETLCNLIDGYVEEFGPITFMVEGGGPITVANVGTYFDDRCFRYSNEQGKMADQSLDMIYIEEVLNE